VDNVTRRNIVRLGNQHFRILCDLIGLDGDHPNPHRENPEFVYHVEAWTAATLVLRHAAGR
jgi:hypothetical protein